MIPRVHYASRSKDEEPGKDSTGDQLKELREHFGEPEAEYADHASGFTSDRGPGLEAAMAHAARLGAELCVVKSERFARGSGRKDEARSLMEVYVDMQRAGVRLRSVHDDPYLTQEFVGMASAMANKYSLDLSAHVKRGIRARKAKGLRWGEAPYGELDGEAPVRDRIIREHEEQGRSYGQIAGRLNADGIPARRGGAWSQSSVGRIVQRSQGNQRQPRPPGRLPKQHLLVRGTLRCGLCGGPMLARSDTDSYRCMTRKDQGDDACAMPNLRRAQVEEPLLAIFEQEALDVEATREHVARQLSTGAADARSQAERARLDAGRKRAALERFDRDYESGELSAANYERLSAKATSELAGAEAEVERLEAHADELDRTLAGIDAEHETLRRLADLREAIAGRVTGAERDVGALRAALASVFSEFRLWVEDDGTITVEPRVRPDMIEAYRRRVPLLLEAAPDNDRTTSVPYRPSSS